MTSEKSNVQMMLESVGLFSKAGHMSGVKYPALKFRTQLLSGVTPTVNVDKIALPGGVKVRTLKKPEEMDRIIEASKAVTTCSKREKQAEISPAFSAQSRAQRETAATWKTAAPPVGSYNCSFVLVERRVKTPNFEVKQKTGRRMSLPRRPDYFQSESPMIQRHLRSPVPFEKQCKRPDITTMSLDVNESRFLKFNDMPGINSKYRKAGTPDIARIRPRHVSVKREVRPNFGTYNASYKLVQADLGKVGAEFTKQSPRKPNIHEHVHDLDYERVNFSLVEKRYSPLRVTSPDFHKKIPRPDSSESDLPFFMRKMVSRMSLNAIMDKGLEMNNFAERGFGMVTSSLSTCSPLKTKSSRQSPRVSFVSSPSPAKLQSLNISLGN